MEENEKKKSKEMTLEQALAKIEKQYGKGAIMKMDEKTIVPVEVISSGCLTLDIALGIGGFPRGRIVEVYGPESSGKTTVALHVIASCQKDGGTCAFIDAEHAFDPIYAEKLGVQVKELYVSQPDNGEQALDIADLLVNSKSVDVIVIDSVAALTPRAEIDGEFGANTIGLQARLMSQSLRRITGAISRSHACVIFINQLREKVGVMFGSPEVTPGGKALKFYASVRIDVRKGDAIKDGTDTIGNKTRAKIVKNKLAPPFKLAEFDIIFGRGISQAGCTLDLAVEHDLVKKSGSWFSYNDEKIGQGRDKSVVYLDENPQVLEEIKEKILKILSEKK